MTSSDLLAVFEDVAEKTGTEVYLEPRGGEETCFRVTFRGTETKAYLAGTGEEAEKRAKLVAYLIENEPTAAPDRKAELKAILLGEGGTSRAFRYLIRNNLSDGVCFAVDILPHQRTEEAVAHLERCVYESQDAVVRIDDKRIAVVRFFGEEQSPYEYARFLSLSLYEEIGVKASVGVGCEVKSFSEIASSYAQAATAVRMSGIFHNEGEVHSYREYLLVKLLEDVPPSRLAEYFRQFGVEGSEEIFEDAEMTATAEAFLESSLNISETSRNLYMHRNTLSYRLDKIERATGLNIRKFSDAVTFRVLTILHRLLK